MSAPLRPPSSDDDRRSVGEGPPSEEGPGSGAAPVVDTKPAPEPRPVISREQMLATCERGIDLCRFGSMKEGFATLASLGDITKSKDLPSAYFSYLGYGLAKYRNQISQGIKLCRHAIKLEFFQPENYVNMARTCLLQERYRREAVDAVREGLRIDPENPELQQLEAQLGQRRPPVLGFLGRQNPVNQALGWLRHRLSGRTVEPLPAPEPPPTKRPPRNNARGGAAVSMF
jgi:hypothetical protein